MIRRGPSGWSHVGRWDVDRGVYEPGSWLRGRIYPQRCDVSPDGRWFVYLVLKGTSRWALGSTYLAVSRLPWLTALAAWRTCGTWTRGLHFVGRRASHGLADPDEGDLAPLRRRYGLAATAPGTFLVERRRGWTESPDTPPRDPGDAWDERRADRIWLEKERPASPGSPRLIAAGRFAAFREAAPDDGPATYALAVGNDVEPLSDVQWADWSADARLLVATRSGRLEVREAPFDAGSAVWAVDLAGMRPDPRPAPEEARRW